MGYAPPKRIGRVGGCAILFVALVVATFAPAAAASYRKAATAKASATVKDVTFQGDVTTIPTTFLPTADARVERAYPNTNFGSSYLRTDGGGDPPTETNLRFTLAGLSGTVTRATLRLYAKTDTVDGPTLHVGATNWSESSVTWRTRPTYAAESTSDTAKIVAGSWVEYDVTPAVSGAGSVSFALRSNSSDGVNFDSREGKMPPQLVVTTLGGSVDTEPPTAPSGLLRTSATETEISLSWLASSDDAGVAGYGVYVNGAGAGSTAATGYTLSALACGTSYTVSVDAYDASGNRSAQTSISASTTACAIASGGSGGFANPGNLPPATWRPYMDAAAWNRGTTGATVHANSAAMVEYLRSTSGGKMQNIVVGAPGSESTDGAPLYFARADDPLYTISCTQWVSSCEVHGLKVRIPRGAKPVPAYDRHLVVIQPDGWEIDLWESSVPSGTGGTLTVSHGGRTRIDGDSTGSNATAAVTGAIAGQIRSNEWIAGTINHALALTIPRVKAGSVYPVREDDCSGHDGAVDASSPVPTGQWFKLNVTDTEIAAQPAWRRPIYRAMRDYGLFVVDTGTVFQVEHEHEFTYQAFGVADPAYAWLQGQPGVDAWNGQLIAKTPAFAYDKLVALNPPPPALPCP